MGKWRYTTQIVGVLYRSKVKLDAQTLHVRGVCRHSAILGKTMVLIVKNIELTTEIK
jgi:hypothetical protein